MAHKIKGTHCEDGYSQGPGSYLVEIGDDGRIFDADPIAFGDELFVRQYGNDAPILTNGCWEFWPDQGDLDRLGIRPVQMIAA